MVDRIGLTAGEIEIRLQQAGLSMGQVSNPDELRKAFADIITQNNALILEEVRKLINK